MARSMDSILADEPSVHSLPESAESDSPAATAESTEAKADKGETPEKAEAKEPTKTAGQAAAAAAKPNAPKAESDEGEDEGPMPADLEGFKKALAAARGDKRKARKSWQEAERKLAMLEGELNAMRRQPQQAKGEPEKPAEAKPQEFDWENPTGFVKKLVQESAPDVDAVAMRQRADISEFYARRDHADYDEKKAYFLGKAQQDPALWHRFQQILQEPVPAEALYRMAASLQAREEFERDPDAWREAELVKLRSKLEAEAQSTAETRQVTAKPIPKSIAGARGSGVGVQQAWSGPRSLDQIVGS
jgi:hypothetical protein